MDSQEARRASRHLRRSHELLQSFGENKHGTYDFGAPDEPGEQSSHIISTGPDRRQRSKPTYRATPFFRKDPLFLRDMYYAVSEWDHEKDHNGNRTTRTDSPLFEYVAKAENVVRLRLDGKALLALQMEPRKVFEDTKPVHRHDGSVSERPRFIAAAHRVARLVDRMLQKATVWCALPIRLMFKHDWASAAEYANFFSECNKSKSKVRENPGESRGPLCPFGKLSEYLVMYTGSEDKPCVLSILEIVLNENKDRIEISSNTAKSQLQKGYNGLMRAVAVMIACACDIPVHSSTINYVSAYALMKTYQTKVEQGGSILTFQDRLGDGAKDFMHIVRAVIVLPTAKNFDYAVSVFKAKLQCAGIESVSVGSSSKPIGNLK